MEINNEVNKVKFLILYDFGQALRLVLRSSADGAVLGNDSCLVQSLSHSIDRILRHGLRDLHKGYWPIVQDVTHSATIQLINSLKSVHSLLGKGRAWLYLSLTEGSLESYLQCLLRDKQALRKHYLPHSFMRDESALDQFLSKIVELQNVQFFLNPDVSYLDMSSYKQQALMESQSLSLMTTSASSSLASPVDSGVALLDSDLDATSVSEATCSFRDDDSSVTEMDINKDEHLTDLTSCRESSASLTDDEPVIAIEMPLLCEAILLTSHDTHNSTPKTRVRNAWELEEALLNDAAAHLASNVSMHNPGIQEAQLTNKCNIGSAPTYSQMSESDIVNRNVDSIDCKLPIQSCEESTETIDQGSTPIKVKKDKKDATDCDEIVFRRQRKKKNKAEVKVKRVSFHEDVLLNSTEDVKNVESSSGASELKNMIDDLSSFSASFLPPNAVIKKDVAKGRYSWCGEGDAPYTLRSNNSGTKSDVYPNSVPSLLMQDTSKQHSHLNPNNPNNSSSNNIYEYISNDIDNNSQRANEMLQPLFQTFIQNRGSQGIPSFNYSALESNLKSFPIHEERYSQDSPKFVDSTCQILQMDSLFQSSNNESNFAERGIPEGQEDPQKMCPPIPRHASGAGNLSMFSSMGSNLDCFSDSESAADFNVRRNLTKRNSLHGSTNRVSRPLLDSKYGRMSTFDIKASLLNRFLKLVTVKKFVEKQAEAKKLPRSLYIKGVKFDPEINREYDISLKEHIFKCQADLPKTAGFNVEISADFESILKGRVFSRDTELVYKVFRIRGCYFVGGLSMPLLLLLTDAAIYITGVRENYSFCNHLIMPYSSLDTILIGPNGCAVEIASTDRQSRFVFTTGDAEMTRDLVGSIEVAMRRSCQGRVPGVRCLNCDDMVSLRRSLVKQGALFEEDPLLHYSLVFLQDNQYSTPCTPLGPTKEGHLMFRIATKGSVQSWTPGYFILKAGVVYMFEDQGHRLPKQVLMLRNGQCKGCQRLLHDRRPHTFQIILGSARAVQFAASDEYEASDWLQAFIQAAGGVYQEDDVATTACTLVLTSRRIVTCAERFPSGRAQALSVANIADLTAYYACESWCVLEFACQEVNESSGDWILYFTSVFERETFQRNLQLLWQKLNHRDEFPLKHTMEVNVLTRCEETSQLLSQAWDHLLASPTMQ